MRNKTPLSEYLKLSFGICFLSFLLYACNTVRKSQRQINRIGMQHPELLADYAAKNFPPIVKPGKPDTVYYADTAALQARIDSLTQKMTDYKQSAKEAINRADSAIYASLRNNDTACAALLTGLRATITNQRDKIDDLLGTLKDVQTAYNYLKEHPTIVTQPITVLDSAVVYTLTKERDNYKNQLAGKDGEIKQLSKTNRNKNIAITVMGIIIIGGLYLKFKPF